MINLIADRLPITDRLHLQQAFSSDLQPAVAAASANIRASLADNLAMQRALLIQIDMDAAQVSKYRVCQLVDLKKYSFAQRQHPLTPELRETLKSAPHLLMGLGEYRPHLQYNYRLERKLPSNLLPALEGLPLEKEAILHLSLSEWKSLQSSNDGPGHFRHTFPRLQSLKVVLRDCSSAGLTRLINAVTGNGLSEQLTSLQLLIFNDSTSEYQWKVDHLLRLFSHLNSCRFARLRHFTLVFEDLKNNFQPPFHLPGELKLLAKVEECYLRLPSQVLQRQLPLLRANVRLQRFGFIVNDFQRWAHYEEPLLTAAITSQLAAKCAHLQYSFRGFSDVRRGHQQFYSRQIRHTLLHRLKEFTSLRVLHLGPLNVEGYLWLVGGPLGRLTSLTSLRLSVHFTPISLLTVRRLEQLQLATPFQSVSHLKLTVVTTELPAARNNNNIGGNTVEFSHQIISQLNVVHLFANCRLVEVKLPQDYFCAVCNERNVDGENGRCFQQVWLPFHTLAHLEQLQVNVIRQEFPQRD